MPWRPRSTRRSAPLFLGRKPCLPSRPLLAGRIEADGVRMALLEGLARLAGENAGSGAPHRSRKPKAERRPQPRRHIDPDAPVAAQWPLSEGDAGARTRTIEICDERATSGVHAGLRTVVVGWLGGRPGEAASPEDPPIPRETSAELPDPFGVWPDP